MKGPVLLWISSYKRSGGAQGAVNGGGRGLNWRDRGWRVRLRARGGVNSFDGVIGSYAQSESFSVSRREDPPTGVGAGFGAHLFLWNSKKRSLFLA